MKVLFLTAHSELAPASRIKVYQLLPLFKKRGIKYRVICFTPSFVYRIRLNSTANKKLLPIYYLLLFFVRLYKTFVAILWSSKFDIVFSQEPIIFPGFEGILKLVNKNIILLFTDAVFLEKQGGSGFFESLRAKIVVYCWKRMVKTAKSCIVENEYNRKATLEFCNDVDIITGPIDSKRFFFVENKKAEDKIVIGWTGSAFTTKYLYEIKGALREISQKYPVVLRLIGPKKDFNMPGVNCQIKDWSIDTEIEWLKTFDIGLTPLVDDAWVRGKASYKLLQYMSMGIPCVASRVGFNEEAIKDGFNGFLATTEEEWVKKLSLLIENETLRKQIGKNSRAVVEQKYSLTVATNKLIKIFEKTLKLND